MVKTMHPRQNFVSLMVLSRVICQKNCTFARKACENGLRFSNWNKFHCIQLASSLSP